MTRPSAGRILSVMLDTQSTVPLHRQVYASVRTSILEGRLKPGVGLPSTRSFATDLKVSRSTIVLAYDQLRAEGYLTSRLGGRTRVADIVPEALVRPEPPRDRAHTRTRRTTAIQPTHAEALRHALYVEPRVPRAFRSGVPALDAFPVEAWTRAITASLRKMPPRHLSYGATFGLPALREAVAEYLAGARGVRCTADQVMIVNGSQQALSLSAMALISRGDQVWLEDPFYAGARGAFTLAGAQIIPVGVDDQGLIVDEGRRRAPDARAVFVTPSRQLPLGVTMSLARRLELLEWAHAANAWIIEDDYDSEFRYSSRPLTALQGLDRHGSVIYTGTFSKVMFPSMRLGYMVIPDEVRDVYQAVRHFADTHSSYLEQAAMARFMAEGEFERHIRRMRTLYLERQQVLVSAAKQYLGNRVRVPAPDAGMTLIAWLRDGDDDIAIADAIGKAGVAVVPISNMASDHHVPPGLLLGYSGVRPDEIREGIITMAKALACYDRTRG
jgi:GntR family transcriptional regulator/MocR family aminotransferase